MDWPADFKLDDRSGASVKTQLVGYVSFLIRTGKLAPGDELPTVRDLAQQTGVCYNTVHNAYKALEEEGLVVSSRGKRSRVAQGAAPAQTSAEAIVDTMLADAVTAARKAGIPMADLERRLQEAYRAQSSENSPGGGAS